MNDPIANLIAAAREACYVMMCYRGNDLDEARRKLEDTMHLAEAAEARPEPKPMPIDRWDYVQGACYCRVCKQEADECECEKDRPEPAAEPSIIPALREVSIINGDGNTSRALDLLCDAVEALAREVRK